MIFNFNKIVVLPVFHFDFSKSSLAFHVFVPFEWQLCFVHRRVSAFYFVNLFRQSILTFIFYVAFDLIFVSSSRLICVRRKP